MIHQINSKTIKEHQAICRKKNFEKNKKELPLFGEIVETI